MTSWLSVTTSADFDPRIKSVINLYIQSNYNTLHFYSFLIGFIIIINLFFLLFPLLWLKVNHFFTPGYKIVHRNISIIKFIREQTFNGMQNTTKYENIHWLMATPDQKVTTCVVLHFNFLIRESHRLRLLGVLNSKTSSYWHQNGICISCNYQNCPQKNLKTP